MNRSAALLLGLAACGPTQTPDVGDDDGSGTGWTVTGNGVTQVTATFQAANGQFVVAENGGGGIVNANRNVAGPWETFRVDLLDSVSLVDGVHVRIHASNDLYLVAQNHGGGWLHADSNKAGT